MTSGIIDLSSLYEFVRRIDNPYKILRVKTPEGLKYKNLVGNLMSEVSEKSGFYLWGQFDKKYFWTNIYLGKATLGKISSLRYRIRDEIGEERAFLLQAKMTEELDKECRDIYPKKWDSYKNLYERALLKHKARYIIWAEFESSSVKDIEEIESDLIETINPESNKKRPTPPTHLRKETMSILNNFRKQIHKQRDLLSQSK